MNSDTGQGVSDTPKYTDAASGSNMQIYLHEKTPSIPDSVSKHASHSPSTKENDKTSLLTQPLTMLRCVVNLTCLTEDELHDATSDQTPETEVIGGYNMKKHHVTEPKLDRYAKYNIKYCSSSDYSSDESYGHQPQRKRKIAAISGPSRDSIAAQERRKRENIAASALLELNNPPGHGNDSSSSDDNPNDKQPPQKPLTDVNPVENKTAALNSHPGKDNVNNSDSDSEPLSSVQRKL